MLHPRRLILSYVCGVLRSKARNTCLSLYAHTHERVMSHVAQETPQNESCLWRVALKFSQLRPLAFLAHTHKWMMSHRMSHVCVCVCVCVTLTCCAESMSSRFFCTHTWTNDIALQIPQNKSCRWRVALKSLQLWSCAFLARIHKWVMSLLNRNRMRHGVGALKCSQVMSPAFPAHIHKWVNSRESCRSWTTSEWGILLVRCAEEL